MELTGQLLVATPALRDPNFDRSVVLVLGHEQSGALGVVLNRATGTAVGEVLPGWDALAREPAVLFEGGPVQPDSAICVAWARPGVAGFLGFSRVVGRRSAPSISPRTPPCSPSGWRRSASSPAMRAGPPGIGGGDRGWVVARVPVAPLRRLRRQARGAVADGLAAAGRAAGGRSSLSGRPGDELGTRFGPRWGAV